MEGRREAILAELREWVEHESPSRDKTALDALARKIARRWEAIGAQVDLVANPSGGDHVVGRWGEGTGRPILVLGHFDTVWPAGTLQRLPFRVEDGRASGPGIYDMKAGLALLNAAMSVHPPGSRPVVALWTSDEEIGSPTSRNLIEDQARSCACALVLEPALADGSLKTARKGVGRYVVEVEGRAAHSGIEPEKGISAIVELAHQVLTIQGLQDLAAGTTVNVGVVQGGTTANVVAAYARAEVDVRAAASVEAERLDRAFRDLAPRLPGARLKVEGRFTRPPMERSPRIAALFDQARRIGRTVGLELTEGATGGGSDGNFTAALGVPTLDGLGARGGGAHADHEHVVIESLPERAALLAALLRSLDLGD